MEVEARFNSVERLLEYTQVMAPGRRGNTGTSDTAGGERPILVLVSRVPIARLPDT